MNLSAKNTKFKSHLEIALKVLHNIKMSDFNIHSIVAFNSNIFRIESEKRYLMQKINVLKNWLRKKCLKAIGKSVTTCYSSDYFIQRERERERESE